MRKLIPQKLCLAATIITVLGSQQIPATAQSSLVVDPPADSLPADYVLGPGDQVAITVFDYEEYTGSKVILPDGTIRLPLIGAVMAANRTPDKLAEELTARLKFYLVNPVVTVSLVTLRPVIVTVGGEVQRPGAIQLQGLTSAAEVATTDSATGNNSTPPTVSTALIAAGGITSNADLRNITLRRASPTGEVTTTVNLWDMISSNPISQEFPQDPVLQPGDSIIVPRLPVGEVVDRQLAARSQLAPVTIPVKVVGEVVNPGEVQVSPNSSISSAIAVAGGPTDDARLSRVTFIRLSETGTIEPVELDLRNLTDTYQVQEGDVIIVPKRNSASFLDFAGRLANPVNLILNLLNGL